jgi:hypothetical protein
MKPTCSEGAARGIAGPTARDAAGAIARNEALPASNYLGRAIWRKWSGYHRRSRAETNMHGVKLLRQSLMARDVDRQVAELPVRGGVAGGRRDFRVGASGSSRFHAAGEAHGVRVVFQKSPRARSPRSIRAMPERPAGAAALSPEDPGRRLGSRPEDVDLLVARPLEGPPHRRPGRRLGV